MQFFKFGARQHPTTYPKAVVGPVASDGAPYSNTYPAGSMLTWPQPALNLPPAWVMTERPQLTKSGYKSALNS